MNNPTVKITNDNTATFQPRIGSVQLPLHICPTDQSFEANDRRLNLHQVMQIISPNKGFRLNPTSKKGSKAVAAQKSPKPITRIEKLAFKIYS